MYKFEVLGVKELQTKITAIQNSMPDMCNYELFQFGNKMVNELNNEFSHKGYQFIGNHFPQNIEYWITLNGAIFCKATGAKVNVDAESKVGRRSQKGKSYSASPESETLFDTQFNWGEVIEKYGPELKEAIESKITLMLK